MRIRLDVRCDAHGRRYVDVPQLAAVLGVTVRSAARSCRRGDVVAWQDPAAPGRRACWRVSAAWVEERLLPREDHEDPEDPARVLRVADVA